MLREFTNRPLPRARMCRKAAKPQHFWAVIAALVAGCTIAPAVAGASSSFETRLELQGFAFNVSATNEGSINQLTVTPSGLGEQQGPL